MEEQEIREEKPNPEVAASQIHIKRKYKDITCRKCGTVYPSLYKECPECGFSMTKQVLKALIAVLLLGIIIGSLTFLIIRINKLEERVSALESSSQSDASTGGVDLTELDYYQQQLIYDGANLSAFGDGGEYLIYAIQDDCSACAEMSETIYMFLYYGYPDYIPMYFITPESASSIFFDVLDCESTPTLYRMKGEQILKKAEGTDEVYTMLDDITAEAQESTQYEQETE